MRVMLVLSMEKLKFTLLIFFTFCALTRVHGTAQAEDCSKYAYQNPYQPDDGGKAIIDCLNRKNEALMRSVEEALKNFKTVFLRAPVEENKTWTGGGFKVQLEK